MEEQLHSDIQHVLWILFFKVCVNICKYIYKEKKLNGYIKILTSVISRSCDYGWFYFLIFPLKFSSKGIFASSIREKHNWPLFNDWPWSYKYPTWFSQRRRERVQILYGRKSKLREVTWLFFFFNVIVNGRAGVKPWLLTPNPEDFPGHSSR